MAANEIDDLNAEAAACLSSASFLEAAKRWCRLLQLLLPHLHVQSATLEGSDAAAAPVPSASGLSSLDLQFVDVHRHESVEEEHVFAAFRCGIVYASPGSSPGGGGGPSYGPSWGEREYRKAAIATCYNMALSHHLHGLQDANNAASLEKALTTYRLARGLLESTVPDVTAETHDVMILALAIANNEGHVLASRYDMPGARECWLDMQWLLRHAAPAPETLHFFATAATFPGDEGIFSLHAPVA